MPPEEAIEPEHRPGDKVRIRSGPHRGGRGIIRVASPDSLQVAVGADLVLNVPPIEVTNYSLAARRAWTTMPKRSGRPRLPVPRKKMVSIRIDIDIWEALGRAAGTGLIRSREEAVNNWLREQVEMLEPQRSDRYEDT